MNNKKGYILLHRDILDHWVFQDSVTFKFFTYCLLKANFEDRTFVFNNKQIELKRGQLIFGRKAFSNRLDISEKILRRVVQNLVKDEILGQQTSTQYTVLTIKKYDDYQIRANAGPTKGQRRANAGPHINTLKELNTLDKAKPTLDQVKEFCLKENLAIDAEYYFNSQEAVGWVNKNGQKVKSWKASIKTWNRNEIKWHGGRTNNNQPELGV